MPKLLTLEHLSEKFYLPTGAIAAVIARHEIPVAGPSNWEPSQTYDADLVEAALLAEERELQATALIPLSALDERTARAVFEEGMDRLRARWHADGSSTLALQRKERAARMLGRLDTRPPLAIARLLRQREVCGREELQGRIEQEIARIFFQWEEDLRQEYQVLRVAQRAQESNGQTETQTS